MSAWAPQPGRGQAQPPSAGARSRQASTSRASPHPGHRTPPTTHDGRGGRAEAAGANSSTCSSRRALRRSRATESETRGSTDSSCGGDMGRACGPWGAARAWRRANGFATPPCTHLPCGLGEGEGRGVVGPPRAARQLREGVGAASRGRGPRGHPVHLAQRFHDGGGDALPHQLLHLPRRHGLRVLGPRALRRGCGGALQGKSCKADSGETRCHATPRSGPLLPAPPIAQQLPTSALAWARDASHGSTRKRAARASKCSCRARGSASRISHSASMGGRWSGPHPSGCLSAAGPSTTWGRRGGGTVRLAT